MDLQEYLDFPAARWTVYFHNSRMTDDTPVLEDIQALDTTWQGSAKTAVFHAKGSDAQMDDFLPLSASLPQLGDDNKPLTFGCRRGRPSTLFLPYFNLQDNGQGVMIAIGWSGQWAASFQQDIGGNVRARAGMEQTHLVLHAGETIRAPSILTIFWQGHAMRGHNLLRQFILHHNSPRKDGQVVTAPLACADWGGQLSSVQIEHIKRSAAAKLPFDTFWIDAGWYGDAGGKFLPESTGHWYKQAGNWAIDRSIHPDGLLEVRKAARDAGMGMLLWVEPERAVWGSPVTKAHPDWFLGKKEAGNSVLLNLGDPEARKWATDLISGLVRDLDLTWYRQDFNMDCLDQWRSIDAPDRQGMAEIRYVEGLYAFWDELQRRKPGLMIDNCASGGRRLNLELLARSIPLWRTDYHCGGREHDPSAGQIHTMGLSYWIPLSGTAAAAGPMDTYTFRSNLTAAMAWGAPPDLLTNAPFAEWCRTMLKQYLQARPFFYGDYYPLTRTSANADAWAAYQLHRRDLDQGLLVMLRRTESPFSHAQLLLGGLDPTATYEFTDADSGKAIRCTGKEAMAGATWVIDAPRSSRLVFYRRVK